ncbi:MAG: hypothetical protein IPO81_09230 [Kouleothrix sp.]|nr:hypothetical protein [Kouleothrix sp.]
MPSQEDIANQQSLLQTYRRNLATYLEQQAAQGGPAFTSPGVIGGIYEARQEIARIKQILSGWGVPADDHPNDQAPAPAVAPAPPAVPPTSTQVDRVKLRQIITDFFSDDELRELCFDLGIDYENLPGAGKAAKARELVAYAQRRGRMQDLVTTCQQLRPNAPW